MNAVDSVTLQKTLGKLHEQLQGAPQVDDESRRLLQQIMDDVKRLDRTRPATGGTQQYRLELLAVRFEGDHPTLAAALREFIELLGQVGL
jgi:hypothetical protein